MEEYASGKAYEGRKDLGNTQPGDGKRYKGRGIFQLTGRANYKSYGDRLGLDLVATPELASDVMNAVKIACEYWTDKKLNDYADKDDVKMITKRINGGYNGLEDRERYLKRAKVIVTL
jgi:putative chitinase